jgi:glyoxylase I family protein
VAAGTWLCRSCTAIVVLWAEWKPILAKALISAAPPVDSLVRYATIPSPLRISSVLGAIHAAVVRPSGTWEGTFTERAIMAEERESSAAVTERDAQHQTGIVKAFHGVRYQVSDVARAVKFYTEQLGFRVEHQQLPAFANVSLGELDILLSGRGASGSRPMSDGRQQEPGGWNRVVLRVSDLPTVIESMKERGLRFRNQMEVGPGGRQIQLEDPDGNPIELFEPAR